MTIKLIETAAALRKISAENKAPRDDIDEAADLLDQCADAEAFTLRVVQAVRRFAVEMRSISGMKIDADCTHEQFVNIAKFRANIWLSELAENIPDLDAQENQDIKETIDGLISHWRMVKAESDNEHDIHTAACYVDAFQSLRVTLGFGTLDAARAPTPAGWSDTDWIKHLAAADAYEAEYNAAHNAK